MSGGAAGFKGVRLSKFRHLYGRTGRREDSYEGFRASTAAHESQLVAVNPKFLAVAVEVAGGGAFQVIPLKWTGKVAYHLGRVTGGGGAVTELKWDPFNDNVLATGSEDGRIGVWGIADEGPPRGAVPLVELCAHTRRVAVLEWHPSAEGILASAGVDGRICVWNIASSHQLLVQIDLACEAVHSLSFNATGTRLAATSKDRCLRVFDPRNGNLLQEWEAHEGAKASKAIFLGDRGLILSTGFTAGSRRQLALWSEVVAAAARISTSQRSQIFEDGGPALFISELDASSGVTTPFFDQDLSIVFVAGKGDGNIRYYELGRAAPWLFFLSEFQSRFPQRGLGVMPKRGLSPAQCEVWRFYKLHSTQSLVEPIAFIVPRKSEAFQRDLYPPTAGPVPGLSADEWLGGLARPPVAVDLRALPLPLTTSKPATVARRTPDDAAAALITSDRNNDRKFQFLAQVTCPDYRDIKERDDFDSIVEEQQVRQKILETLGILSRANSVEQETREVHVAPKKRDSSSSEMESGGTGQDAGSEGASSPPPLPSSQSAASSHSASPHPSPIPRPKFHSAAPRPQPFIHAPTIPLKKVETRPGRIGGGGGIVGRQKSAETTATIRPFRVASQQQASLDSEATSTPRHSTATSTPTHAPPPTAVNTDGELSRLRETYATQCRRMRELLAEAESREARVAELAKALDAAADDAASFRHEIAWKDARITALEAQLSAQSHA